MILATTGIIHNAAVHGQDISRLGVYRAEYAEAKDDTARAMALSEIGFNMIQAAPDSARFYLTKALMLAERLGHHRAKATAQVNLAWLEEKQGNEVKGDALARSALVEARAAGDSSLVGTVLGVLAGFAEQRGDLPGAMRLYRASLDQWEDLGKSGPAASTLYNIGRLYERMREYPRARGLFERALAVHRESGSRNSEANCLLMIGATWNGQGEVAKALDHYAQAERIFKELDNHRGMGLAAENSGMALKSVDGERAIGYFRKALEHFSVLGNATDEAIIRRQISDVLVGSGRLDEAGRMLDSGYALIVAVDPNEELEYALALAQLSVKQGKSDEALAHYQRHMALKDSLQGAEAQRELMRLRAEFETEQAERENALLKTENEVRRLSEERLRNRWITASGAAMLLVALLALLYRNYRLRGRHARAVERFNAELQTQRDQVQHMNDLLELKILRSQLNPHFIHNCHNSAVAMVKEGRNVEALAYLQGLSKLMRMVLEHSVSDRITVEEEMAFLRLYVKLEALRLPGLQFEVDADRELLDDEAELPALLVQPFVENALWHGLAEKEGPRQLSIRFSATDKGLRCVVRDNGVGRRSRTNPSTPLPSTPLRDGAAEGHRSLGTELTNERLQLLTHRLQQKGRFTIHDLKDDAGGALGTEVIIDLEG